ncbi:MAG TPA: hypothetical protein VFH31_13575 [Pyrinomonadaceae bacterium]|nr:hypothetical protein [Pyrinomonadaceae bacterium]
MVKLGRKENSHGHATETPDVSHIKNIDVTHEVSDVNVPALLKFVGALTVMTIAVYFLMWGLFRFFNTQVTRQEPSPGPMALSEQEKLPPEPRLQGAPGFGEDLAKSAGDSSQQKPDKPKDPLWEIRVLRQQWEQQLRTGATDSSGKPVGIPIEEAMKKVLEQGLPSRSQPGSQQEFPEQGISIPTVASSGRVSMRGKQ